HEATHNPQTFINGEVSRDGHWLFVVLSRISNSADIYFRDLRKPSKSWTTLVEGVPANFSVRAFRDAFYVRTDDGAPRYRLFAVDPKQPSRARWREIVPEDAGTLEAFAVIGGRLVLTYLRQAASQVEVHDLSGKRLHAIDVPPLGSVGQLVGLPTEDTAYLSYTSFTEPQVIYK